MPAAEVVAAGIAHHGEGAVWWPATSTAAAHLRLVDAYEGELVDLWADGTSDRTGVGDYAACVRPRAGGGAVVAADRGFALLDPDGTLHPATEVLGEGCRMNDGACDPDGAFWCGSMAWDAREGAGGLYRLRPGGDVTVMLHGATIANGLAWSPDGTRVFWNDTPTHTVWTFDYGWDVGLMDRRPFVRLGDDEFPDGLTVDRTGAVWVALWGGSAVRRYDTGGRLDAVVDVAARQVSSCTIGGADLDVLYVTTSRENLAAGDDPLAGSVFAFGLGESLGVPPTPFAG